MSKSNRATSGKLVNKSTLRPSVVGSDEPVLMEGYLEKKSNLFGRWLPRYFVVSGRYLKYYDAKPENNDPTKPKGYIDLTNLKQQILRGRELKIKEHDVLGVLTLRCHSPEEAAEWNSVLNNATAAGISHKDAQIKGDGLKGTGLAALEEGKAPPPAILRCVLSV